MSRGPVTTAPDADEMPLTRDRRTNDGDKAEDIATVSTLGEQTLFNSRKWRDSCTDRFQNTETAKLRI